MPLTFEPSALALVLLAFCCSYLLTWLARLVAPRLGLMDRPDGQRKLHSRATPLLGGAAVYLSVAIGAALLWRFGGTSDADPGEGTQASFHWIWLAAGGVFCVLGLCDDKYGLRPRDKFLLQVLASIPFVVWGRSIDAIDIAGQQFDMGLLGGPLTVLWLVASANVINLVDGLDGLAGSISLIAAGTIAALALMTGKLEVAALALVLSGSLAGFLVHNWPPAKIFLGDAGSLTIGFFLGALSLEASFKTAAGFTLMTPVVLLCIPIFDTAMAILRRKLNGRGIGEADRAHIHHLLQDRGLTRSQTLLAIASLCVLTAVAAVTATFVRSDLLGFMACVVLLVVLIAGRVFGYHETLLFVRYLHLASRALAETPSVLRSRIWLARLANANLENEPGFWDEVRQRWGELGGLHLEFTCRDKKTGDIVQRMNWRNKHDAEAGQDTWNFSYTAPRGDHWLATFSASGLSSSQQGTRSDDLFRLFETLCQSWPMPTPTVPGQSRQPASSAADRRTVIPIPAPDQPAKQQDRRVA